MLVTSRAILNQCPQRNVPCAQSSILSFPTSPSTVFPAWSFRGTGVARVHYLSAVVVGTGGPPTLPREGGRLEREGVRPLVVNMLLFVFPISQLWFLSKCCSVRLVSNVVTKFQEKMYVMRFNTS